MKGELGHSKIPKMTVRETFEDNMRAIRVGTGVDIDFDGRESSRTSSSTSEPDGVRYEMGSEGGFHLLLSSVQIRSRPHTHKDTSIMAEICTCTRACARVHIYRDASRTNSNF